MSMPIPENLPSSSATSNETKQEDDIEVLEEWPPTEINHKTIFAIENATQRFLIRFLFFLLLIYLAISSFEKTINFLINREVKREVKTGLFS